MFKYLNESFINSSRKTKIELYLLPILILFVYLILFENKEISEDTTNSKIDLYQFENKKLDVDLLLILKQIDDFSKNNSVIILKSQNSKDKIFIKAKSNIENILDFLEDIENLNSFSKIETLNLSKDEESYLLDLKVDFSKFTIKKLNQNNKEKEVHKNLQEEDAKEKITQKSIEEIKLLSELDFELNAVISNYAFVNKKWLKINDEIDGYKINAINRDFVTLKNIKNLENEIKLELDYAKRLKYTKNSD